MSECLLTINTGSSSLKAVFFRLDPSERLVVTARVERIGLPGSHLRVADAGSTVLLDQKEDLSGHEAAIRAFLSWLLSQDLDRDLIGIGAPRRPPREWCEHGGTAGRHWNRHDERMIARHTGRVFSLGGSHRVSI